MILNIFNSKIFLALIAQNEFKIDVHLKACSTGMSLRFYIFRILSSAPFCGLFVVDQGEEILLSIMENYYGKFRIFSRVSDPEFPATSAQAASSLDLEMESQKLMRKTKSTASALPFMRIK